MSTKHTEPTPEEQLDEVLRDMRAAARNPDKERGHADADDYLVRLVRLLTDGAPIKVQRSVRLTLGAYKRGTHWCA